jgi:hypothetical protein
MPLAVVMWRLFSHFLLPIWSVAELVIPTVLPAASKILASMLQVGAGDADNGHLFAHRWKAVDDIGSSTLGDMTWQNDLVVDLRVDNGLNDFFDLFFHDLYIVHLAHVDPRKIHYISPILRKSYCRLPAASPRVIV